MENEIKRVPPEVSGVKDGVQADAKCVLTRYLSDKMGQQVLNCTIMASWETGVLSVNFTEGKQRKSIGVRLDEVVAILKEATEARIDAEKGEKVEKPMERQ